MNIFKILDKFAEMSRNLKKKISKIGQLFSKNFGLKVGLFSNFDPHNFQKSDFPLEIFSGNLKGILKGQIKHIKCNKS